MRFANAVQLFSRFSVVCFLGLSACTSTSIIRDREYRFTEASLRNGDYQQALKDFPKKENGGFITSIEKNWIYFWDQENSSILSFANQTRSLDFKALQQQVRTFDERQMISLSREAETFFYQESEEGYVPAEHEIVLLHLISAMTFLRDHQEASAEVEVRRASEILQTLESQKGLEYNNPSLRIWLGSLWASLGSWDHAQVDFRRAFEMTNNIQFRKLSELPVAPKHLSLVFSGLAPEVEWPAGQSFPRFLAETDPPKLDSEKFQSLNTKSWFDRHTHRNNALRETLIKSNYMSQYLGIKTSTNVESATTHIVSSGVKLTGLVLGTAIVGGGLYVIFASGASSGAAEAIGWVMTAGLAAGAGIWKFGSELQHDWNRSIEADEKKKIEDLKTYRFVRLMPQWISIGVDLDSRVSCQKSEVQLQAKKSSTQLRLIHCPQ